MHRRKLIHLLSVMLLCCAVSAGAQGPDEAAALYEESDTTEYAEDEQEEAPERSIIYNTAAPSAAQWQQVISEDAYSYRDKREYVPKPEKPPETPAWYQFLIDFIGFLSSSAGKVMLWIGLALIVGFIVYRILSGQGSMLFSRRDRRMPAPDADGGSITEESLIGHDWEERLRSALAAGDNRLAIRYSYMHLLQALQERGLIAYRPDKTNGEYYRELTESLRQPFRAVYRQYEYAWYGHFLPAPEAMESYMQTYSGLKKSISYV